MYFQGRKIQCHESTPEQSVEALASRRTMGTYNDNDLHLSPRLQESISHKMNDNDYSDITTKTNS